MTLSASEFYKAGMSPPPSVRKDVALRLLEVSDRQSVDAAWNAEICTRVDGFLSGRAKAIPGEEVMAHLAGRRSDRQAVRQQA